MKIIEWPQFLIDGLPADNKKKSSMTVGVFDGVHLGHQALIKLVVSHSDKVPVVAAFRNPDHKDDTKPHLCRGGVSIQTFEEKAAALESLGVQILIVIDFTESFRHISGIEFLELLFKHGNPGFFAVGADFRCGYQLDTEAQAIRDFFTSRSIPAEIVPVVLHDGLPVSSSRIRAALANGDTELAMKMLGKHTGFQ